MKVNKKSKFMVLAIVVVTIVVSIGINVIYAYYTHQDTKINRFTVGNISIIVEEDGYTDNQVIKPGGIIEKAPTVTNEGTVPCYIRVQVYVPIKEIAIVGEDEQIEQSKDGVELFTLIQNGGSKWVEVTNNSFPDNVTTENGKKCYTDKEGNKYYIDIDGKNKYYEDKDGNKYKVHTYKYEEDGSEKIINPKEKIKEPVFNSVKAVNYLDTDKEITTQVHVRAIGMQSEGIDKAKIDEAWIYYENQNRDIIGL